MCFQVFASYRLRVPTVTAIFLTTFQSITNTRADKAGNCRMTAQWWTQLWKKTPQNKRLWRHHERRQSTSKTGLYWQNFLFSTAAYQYQPTRTVGGVDCRCRKKIGQGRVAIFQLLCGWRPAHTVNDVMGCPPLLISRRSYAIGGKGHKVAKKFLKTPKSVEGVTFRFGGGVRKDCHRLDSFHTLFRC